MDCQIDHSALDFSRWREMELLLDSMKETASFSEFVAILEANGRKSKTCHCYGNGKSDCQWSLSCEFLQFMKDLPKSEQDEFFDHDLQAIAYVASKLKNFEDETLQLHSGYSTGKFVPYVTMILNVFLKHVCLIFCMHCFMDLHKINSALYRYECWSEKGIKL